MAVGDAWMDGSRVVVQTTYTATPQETRRAIMATMRTLLIVFVAFAVVGVGLALLTRDPVTLLVPLAVAVVCFRLITQLARPHLGTRTVTVVLTETGVWIRFDDGEFSAFSWQGLTRVVVSQHAIALFRGRQRFWLLAKGFEVEQLAQLRGLARSRGLTVQG